MDLEGRTPTPATTMPSSSSSSSSIVDPSRDCFPHCIVWSPIFPLTVFLPFVGHMGLGDSRGVQFDFAGPYTIGTRKLAFGPATRYIQLNIRTPQEARDYDAAVQEANETYSRRMHNLFCDNCHSHVARALNTVAYGGSTRWNMVVLAGWMFFQGTFVSKTAILKSWGPSLVLLAVALIWAYK